MMDVADQAPQFAFDNSYARLPGRFFARLAPTPVSAPTLIHLNVALARELGLDPDQLATPQGVAILAGNRVPEGADPLAQAYAGHQFGGFVPRLGDGRAILLGEVIDRDGRRRDIQLKGSGPTPFSRSGDGRAALGPVLRELIVSEAMAALGVPTTRTLAAVMTGDFVWRETPLPGAVLTRVAASHIRVGTFQFFAVRRDEEAVRQLVDHALARHYPEAAVAATPARALLDGVVGRQARLIARWMNVGFIHGVMNTDNTSIAGETIDYGPCAFMDAYNPAQVYSSIDQMGRYAYANQPRIALWNLARLAETLLPLLAPDEEAALAEAQAAIDAFPQIFQAAYIDGLRAKLGLLQPRDGDTALAQDLLDRMAANGADFTLTFRRLADAVDGPAHEAHLRALFADPSSLDAWLVAWRARLGEEPMPAAERQASMRRASPAVIPRNHLIEEVIASAVGAEDFGLLDRMMSALSRPYEDRDDYGRFAEPPRAEEIVTKTFCGT